MYINNKRYNTLLYRRAHGNKLTVYNAFERTIEILESNNWIIFIYLNCV